MVLLAPATLQLVVGARPFRLRDGKGARQLRAAVSPGRSEEHTSELQSQSNLVCRRLLEKKIHNSARRSRGRGTPGQPPRHRLPPPAHPRHHLPPVVRRLLPPLAPRLPLAFVASWPALAR